MYFDLWSESFPTVLLLRRTLKENVSNRLLALIQTEREREKVREKEGERGRERLHLWTVPIDRSPAHITTTFTNCY